MIGCCMSHQSPHLLVMLPCALQDVVNCVQVVNCVKVVNCVQVGQLCPGGLGRGLLQFLKGVETLLSETLLPGALFATCCVSQLACIPVKNHPNLPVLTTSGIEDVVRLLWTPGETGLAGVAHRSKLEEQVLHNQERVSDVPQGIPVAALNSLMECPHLMSLLLGGPAQRREGDATDSDDEEGGPANVRCRVN
eukprot:scaffold106791_cov20-Tisochrysis_lutea.AAC.2